MKKKVFVLVLAMVLVFSTSINTFAAVAPDYVYSFEDGSLASTGAKSGDAAIVGAGTIVEDAERGYVFDNNTASATDTMRENYLSLPANIFADVTDEAGFTVSMWIKGSAVSAYWGSIFNAMTDNTAPMIYLGTQGCGRINDGVERTDRADGVTAVGYFDLDNADNMAAIYAKVSDGAWHNIVFTVLPAQGEEKGLAAVYVDGELLNKKPLYENGTKAGYETGTMLTDGVDKINSISVGGNAISWWADPDVKALYDDVAYFNQALTAEEVSALTANYASAATAGATDAVPTTGETAPVMAIALFAVVALIGMVVVNRKKVAR